MPRRQICARGQGRSQRPCQLVAEELDIELSSVAVEFATGLPEYASPLFGLQITSASSSIRDGWQRFRHAGANARAMLVDAAARLWKVDPSSCRTDAGHVLHPESGRSISYGALSTLAATARRDNVDLKPARDFRLIGRPTKRLDTPEKVNGAGVFGPDRKLLVTHQSAATPLDYWVIGPKAAKPRQLTRLALASIAVGAQKEEKKSQPKKQVRTTQASNHPAGGAGAGKKTPMTTSGGQKAKAGQASTASYQGQNRKKNQTSTAAYDRPRHQKNQNLTDVNQRQKAKNNQYDVLDVRTQIDQAAIPVLQIEDLSDREIEDMQARGLDEDDDDDGEELDIELTEEGIK